jgi:hypothetical protein
MQGALESLMAPSPYEGLEPVAATSRLLREKAPAAARTIAELSTGAVSERVRLRAATYVVDALLGQDARLDHDVVLHRAQVAFVGQALAGAVRALALHFGFHDDDPRAREIVHDALLELAAGPAPTDAHVLDAELATVVDLGPHRG